MTRDDLKQELPGLVPWSRNSIPSQMVYDSYTASHAVPTCNNQY